MVDLADGAHCEHACAIGKDNSGPLRFCNKFIAGNAQSFFNAKLKTLPP
jgi:hypothetical protein